MVEAAGIFQPTAQSSKDGRIDGFQYDLTVERDTLQYSMHTCDGELTEAQRYLLNDLTLRARSQRRQL